MYAIRSYYALPLLWVLGEHPPLSGEAVGMAFGLSRDRAAYVALGAQAGELAMELVVDRLRPLLEGAKARAWSACDAKQVQIVFV